VAVYASQETSRNRARSSWRGYHRSTQLCETAGFRRAVGLEIRYLAPPVRICYEARSEPAGRFFAHIRERPDDPSMIPGGGLELLAHGHIGVVPVWSGDRTELPRAEGRKSGLGILL
jgi:hypothetical protein